MPDDHATPSPCVQLVEQQRDTPEYSEGHHYDIQLCRLCVCRFWGTGKFTEAIVFTLHKRTSTLRHGDRSARGLISVPCFKQVPPDTHAREIGSV